MSEASLLVDIQNDYFTDGAMELVGMEKAAENAAALLERFRKNSRPVYHIRHLSLRKGATFFLPNTAGAEIHPSVQPLDGEVVIEKYFPNSFRETELLAQCRKDEVESLVICGAMSHMCIDATTRAAFDLGFGCTVVEDACATRNLVFKGREVSSSDVHSAFMAALGAVYARVVSLEEFVGEAR
ncbi:MAG: cysteine hydrolase family protein [Candidatus Electrothrix scaldis]|nr:MAG: cysteine hydrolase family protein [Candidatus Electrothrix sp. GW3-3]